MNQFLVKPREKFTDNFPTPDYTDPRCMALINQRDKEANADCVKELNYEMTKNIKIKKYKQLVQSRW